MRQKAMRLIFRGILAVVSSSLLVFAGAVGALRLAMAMPVENWQQIRELDQADRLERQAA